MLYIYALLKNKDTHACLKWSQILFLISRSLLSVTYNLFPFLTLTLWFSLKFRKVENAQENYLANRLPSINFNQKSLFSLATNLSGSIEMLCLSCWIYFFVHQHYCDVLFFPNFIEATFSSELKNLEQFFLLACLRGDI